MTKIDTSGLLAMRSAILEKNDALQRAAGAGTAGGIGGLDGGTAKTGGFTASMKSALAEVNALQAQSSAVTEAYERGETTDIAAVMLSRQQASIGFEATLQVRNKLLMAYKDIMSMPV
ncbi:flagellar hook-basal body complex protein FliE [Sphingomonas sp. LY54]|uniref:flagellar hook-basal body complex protein FliE n=1 Tax=Sphingomonadales TaxID=204457 RepID=UPI002ADEF798|nr:MULTISPECIES: flagellar hook-basal body complex protein FliE [Sphingomonadales]MEA1015942.1 flagellar hook-basal body complex protein FliE [Sphingosinicella sp. LY1275]WRP28311.1 flagellar hook-basal body complex protein FliE [Sphingomonas sp. LY54]